MTSIKVQFGQFSVVISGSEDFVKSQFQEFSSKYHLANIGENLEVSPNEPNETDTNSTITDSNDYFRDFFTIDDDGHTSINMAVPGNNKAEKIKSIVLLVAFARKNDWIPTSMIADECKRQGCWDQSNYAAYVKQCEPLIMTNGKGNNRCVKITVSGMKVAEEKIKSMFSQEQ